MMGDRGFRAGGVGPHLLPVGPTDEEDWHAATDAYVKDGFLFASLDNDASSGTFSPYFHPEVVTEFAKLRSARDTEIVKFVLVWGPPYGFKREGARISEIRRESSKIWLVLELLEAVRTQAEDRARELLSLGLEEPRVIEKSEIYPESPVWSAPFRPEFDPEYVRRDRPPEDIRPCWDAVSTDDPFADLPPLEVAGGTISVAINDDLRHLQPVVMYEGHGTHVLELVGRDLVDVCYWHLAKIAVGDYGADSGFSRCLECKNLFIPSRSDQKFCPPSELWAKSASGRTWSRCGDRYRARHRGQPKGEGQ